jgi:hypothetical protein
MRPYLEKPFTKIGLVEWLRVKVLSSSPSTATTKELGVELNWLEQGFGLHLQYHKKEKVFHGRVLARGAHQV